MSDVATFKYPPCDKRKLVDGVRMCYAIGCCEVGDMACECESCDRPCEKRNKANNGKNPGRKERAVLRAVREIEEVMK